MYTMMLLYLNHSVSVFIFYFPVPINSPVNLTAHNVSSRELKVFWDYVENPRKVLGNLKGFSLYVLEANRSDVFTDDAKSRTFDTDTRRNYQFGGLEIFRLYNISIAARTVKGVGPTNESVVVRTYGEGQLNIFVKL